MRTLLAAGVCAVVLAVVAIVTRSLGGYGQSDLERYRPTQEALSKMRPSRPGHFTPYGLSPKPGEVRPVPLQSGEEE
jgi:hypothetical protein